MLTGTACIGVLHQPPDRRTNVTDNNNHVESILAIHSDLDELDVAIQLGDYNQSNLVWSTAQNTFPVLDVQQSYLPASTSILLDGFSLNGLTQINPIANHNSRILDLVLVNDNIKSESSVFNATEPLIDLDLNHPALEITIQLKLPTVYEDVADLHSLDFHRADYTTLCETISAIDWRALGTATCVDDAVDYFNEQVNQAILDCVPLRRPVPKPPWSNSRLCQLKRARSKALRSYCRSRCPFLKRVFTQASNSYRLYKRFLYKRYMIRTQSNLRRNPKQFWSFVNSKRKGNGLPVEMYLKDKSASTLQGKCNLFVEHFKTAFNGSVASQSQIIAALHDTPRNTVELSCFEISTHLVKAAIDKLKQSSSIGPDGIPACVLKKMR
ncbi:uncharacterized protein LOC134209025 [Armigeres subalbatus]|uniref:uncharacterized protein LOC134209025 n=1 Tax=Armigeres subalbatus TaxID=124917 RepID=UPI002ED1CE21